MVQPSQGLDSFGSGPMASHRPPGPIVNADPNLADPWALAKARAPIGAVVAAVTASIARQTRELTRLTHEAMQPRNSVTDDQIQDSVGNLLTLIHEAQSLGMNNTGQEALAQVATANDVMVRRKVVDMTHVTDDRNSSDAEILEAIRDAWTAVRQSQSLAAAATAGTVDLFYAQVPRCVRFVFDRKAEALKSLAESAKKNKSTAALLRDMAIKEAAGGVVRTADFLTKIAGQPLSRDDLAMVATARGFLSARETLDLARETSEMLAGNRR